MNARQRIVLGFSLIFLLVLDGASRTSASGAPAHLPRLTLWAWERPESLTFLNPGEVAVAFLAETVYLDEHPTVRPRMQPLRVDEGTPLIAVTRLEVTPRTPTAFGVSYIEAVAREIAHIGSFPQVRAVQIDFDAMRSHHDFYRALLTHVRPLLPHGMLLSITALGSWCLGDDWLAGLPIDEAVPMLFRMGIDRGTIMHALETGADFREPLCRSSLGVSTDEPWPDSLLGRRIYVFNPYPWNERTFQAVERKLAP